MRGRLLGLLQKLVPARWASAHRWLYRVERRWRPEVMQVEDFASYLLLLGFEHKPYTESGKCVYRHKSLNMQFDLSDIPAGGNIDEIRLPERVYTPRGAIEHIGTQLQEEKDHEDVLTGGH